MLPQPVKKYPSPKYPTQKAVLNDPRILYVTPKRWKTKTGVMTALMLTITTGLTACGSPVSEQTSTPVDSIVASEAPSPSPIMEYMVAGESAEASVPLAVPEGDSPSLGSIPIFQHGDGRGSYGCVSVAPPVFLSEEEAIQVIREEAEAQGVYFTEEKSITGAFPYTDSTDTFDDPGTWEGTLELDGYDKNLNLGVEFVSREDMGHWSHPDMVVATAGTSEFLDTAQRLSAATENVAVFYEPASDDFREFNFDWEDPNADYNAYSAQYAAEQKAVVVEDLRAQVRDFLTWLKGQGVI